MQWSSWLNWLSLGRQLFSFLDGCATDRGLLLLLVLRRLMRLKQWDFGTADALTIGDRLLQSMLEHLSLTNRPLDVHMLWRAELLWRSRMRFSRSFGILALPGHIERVSYNAGLLLFLRNSCRLDALRFRSAG